MSDPKHTPGPWRVVPDEDHPDDVLIEDGTRFVAQVFEGTDHVPGTEDVTRNANATLIAAAPDLLQAAEDLLHLVAIPASDPRRQALERAIAKARGGP